MATGYLFVCRSCHQAICLQVCLANKTRLCPWHTPRCVIHYLPQLLPKTWHLQYYYTGFNILPLATQMKICSFYFLTHLIHFPCNKWIIFDSTALTLLYIAMVGLGGGWQSPPPLLKKTASTVPSQWFVSGRIVLQEWNIVVQSAEQNPMSANVSLLPLFLNSSLCNNYLYILKKWLLLHPPFPAPPPKNKNDGLPLIFINEQRSSCNCLIPSLLPTCQ